MFFRKGVELGAAKSAQCRIAHGHDRRRTRQSIEDRKLTHNPASANEGEDSLGTGAGDHCHLKQTILDAIAAVPRIVGEEQDLICGELHPRRAGKQISREVRRQSRQQLAGFLHKAHTALRYGTRIARCASYAQWNPNIKSYL